jgi:hypothetical protein
MQGWQSDRQGLKRLPSAAVFCCSRNTLLPRSVSRPRCVLRSCLFEGADTVVYPLVVCFYAGADDSIAAGMLPATRADLSAAALLWAVLGELKAVLNRARAELVPRLHDTREDVPL